MVDSITAPSPAPSRALTSSVIYDILDDSDAFLPITPRRPKIGINGSGVLPSPGSLESMLKTTTETGDIGFFSIAPKNYRPPTRKHNRRELSLIEAIGDSEHPLVSVDGACDEPPRPYSAAPESFRPYSRASSYVSYASRNTSTTMGYDRGYSQSPAPSHFNMLGTMTPRNPGSGYPAPRRPRTRPRYNDPPSSRPTSPDKGRVASQPNPMRSAQNAEHQPPRGQTPHRQHWRSHTLAPRSMQPPPIYSVPNRRHMSAQYPPANPHQRYHPGYGGNIPAEGYDSYGRRIMSTGSWYGPPPVMYNSYSDTPLPGPHDRVGYFVPPPSRGVTPMGSPQRGPTPLGSPRRGSMSMHLQAQVSREPALIYNDVVPEDAAEVDDDKAPHEDHYNMAPSRTSHHSSRPSHHGNIAPPDPHRAGQHSRHGHGRYPPSHYPAYDYPEGPMSYRHVSYPGHAHAQHRDGGYGHAGRRRAANSVPYPDMSSQPMSADRSYAKQSPLSGSAASNEESDSPSDSDNSTFSTEKAASSLSPISTIGPSEDTLNESGTVGSRAPSRACTSALTMRENEACTPRPPTRVGRTPSPVKLTRAETGGFENLRQAGTDKLQKQVVIHDETRPGFWTRMTSKFLGRKRSSSMMSGGSVMVG